MLSAYIVLFSISARAFSMQNTFPVPLFSTIFSCRILFIFHIPLPYYNIRPFSLAPLLNLL